MLFRSAGDIIRDTTATVSNGRPKYYDSGTSTYRYVGSAPVYTSSGKPASGAAGDMIAISNNGGKLAYWDTTNNRWSYVFDNSAV